MLTDYSSIQAAERKAFDMLICPFMEAPPGTNANGNGVMTGAQVANEYPAFSYLVDDMNALYCDNQFITIPRLITSPTVLKQEQVLAAQSSYTFNFAANSAPQAGLNGGAVWLNNIVLLKNNVAAIYGVRFRIGYDDVNGQQRIYQTYGQTEGDNFIYNSEWQMQVETETQMSQGSMDDFKEVPQGSVRAIQKYDGMMLVNPIRLISGQLGKLNMKFTALNPAVNALVLSSNAVVECSWLIVSGQASAGQ